MQTEQPTRDQWADWLDHPTTKAYFKRLRDEREQALLMLSEGVFSAEPNRQNIALGMIAGLTKQLNAEIAED
jgi:hypothetical protein